MNITFIGGIHGVGKSTVCHQICNDNRIKYLSASEVLKWEDITEDVKNKKVKDIPLTQDRLINGLTNIVDTNKFYLLDGHYCLLNSEFEITRVPITTFEKINPLALYLIKGDVKKIQQRLELRDHRPYDFQLLDTLQQNELSYAIELSKYLNVELHIGTQSRYSNIPKSLNLLIRNL